MIYASYLLLGLCAGILAGAFGVGGGILIVPALIIFFKQPMHIAVGTSLMVIIATSISGTIRHWSLDNVSVHMAIFIAIGGVVGAIIGASILENIPDIYGKRALAVVLVFAAMKIWFSK